MAQRILVPILLIILAAGVTSSNPDYPSPAYPTPDYPDYPSPAKHPAYPTTPSAPSGKLPSASSTPPPSPKPKPKPSTPSPTHPSPSTVPTGPKPPTKTPSAPKPKPKPSNPPPSTPSPAHPSPSTPKPKPAPSTPTSKPSPTPSTSGQSSSPKTARCKNKNYPKCYNMEHVCPKACPGGCEVDCYTCKPVCKCDKPGAVCQDPRFIGGDGITFYFHGKKDNNFCLVSDSNLHINARFIGRRNENMKRDFTWVQSIGILFDNHKIFIGAQKTATWDVSVDRLALTFDGVPITLNELEGATWKSYTVPRVSIVRVASTNNVIVEVEGKFRITAKVVPITEEESRIHNYGITSEDCFAHLDIGFKFFSLSNEVSGVLGQTYKPNYVSRVNIGAKMPIMGGGKEYETTTLFSPDCSVSRFTGNNGYKNDVSMDISEMPSMSCSSGIDGQGVVCKR